MNRKIYVTKPFLPPKEDFICQINRIWDTNYLTNNGPLVKEFTTKLSDYLETPNISLTVNGHLALEIALKGLKLEGEVITTPFTFASTTHALTACCIKPVFADIRPDNLTLDPQSIQSCITERTTAILPVHVYGHVCDVDAIDRIAAKHSLKVIYDAAHAFGVKKNGHSVGIYGDVSMFSFHATKLFHSIEGGCLTYKDAALTRIFNVYKNFGIEGEENVDYIGGNAKMNEFQAAMGLCMIPYLSQLITERREIAEHYRSRLHLTSGIRLFLPDADDQIEHNYAYFPILIEPELFGVTRDYVYEALKEKDIFCRKYFYPLTCDFGCYRDVLSSGELPVARKVAAQILALPIYNGLTLDQVDLVCDSLLGCQPTHEH